MYLMKSETNLVMKLLLLLLQLLKLILPPPMTFSDFEGHLPHSRFTSAVTNLQYTERSNTETQKLQPAVIWAVGDAVGDAAGTLVLAAEQLLGPVNTMHGFVSIPFKLTICVMPTSPNSCSEESFDFFNA
jgi:hypothetical protein